MPTTYDVITCGSGTVDVFAKTENELISIQSGGEIESLIAFPKGSKILIDQLEFTIGGGGTNTAVGFSKQGLKTGWLGCIGDGTNAELIKNNLKEAKVDFLGHDTKLSTGYSIILNALDHDRTILTHKGANNHLDFAKINQKKLKTKWFYFSSMMNKSYMTQKKLVKFAVDNDIKIALNPSHYQVSLGLDNLKPILKHTTVLIFNKEEAESLTGLTNRNEIFAVLHRVGVNTVVITNGSNRVYASDGKKQYSLKPNAAIKCVESTGAGDAFASGFVGFAIRGKSIQDCLKAGRANSQSVISHHGAKEKLLSYRKIMSQL